MALKVAENAAGVFVEFGQRISNPRVPNINLFSALKKSLIKIKKMFQLRYVFVFQVLY